MFKSLYRIQEHPDRKLGEAVLNFKGVIVILLIMVAQQFMVYGISYAIAYSNAYYGTNFGDVELNLAYDVVTVVLMLFFFARFYWENLKRIFLEFKAVYLWAPLACYLTAMFGNYVVSIFLLILRGEAQDTSNNELVNDFLLQNPLQMAIMVVLVAPLTEETIFRAGLCRSMTSHKNIFVNILGSVLSVGLFALMHVYQYAFFAYDESGAMYLTFDANEFLSILNYIPMAIAFVACSYLCKNFWGSVACHLITNGVSVAIMLLVGMLAVS